MNGLDLLEMDRWWYRLRNSEKNDTYHGEAISPEHLSLWERWVCKYHKNYDPLQDSKDIVVCCAYTQGKVFYMCAATGRAEEHWWRWLRPVHVVGWQPGRQPASPRRNRQRSPAWRARRHT